jgi:hypothetical protein
MTVTQQAGDGINGILNSVFSFLQRRTDFFYEAEPGDKMGFPPKFAEGLVSINTVIIVFRFTNSSKNTKLSTRKNSHLREKLWQRGGRLLRKTRKK